ncbi:MAG: DNA mismatch repair protein MutS [Chloroflexi bacterium]|nr:DNA mismatch repair protein MutS [Chloroflexota bacterium]
MARPRETITPVRRQFLSIKKRYPDAIVLFRLGDFYEAFDEDARIVAGELEIVLTAREMGKGVRVPMAGIPHHVLDSYLGRLVRKGYKVAVCEQLTDPAASKGLVERDVIRVVTPGTVMEPGLLEQKANNYLAALVVEGQEAGLAYADITTAEFAVTQIPLERLAPELERLAPAELVLPSGSEPPAGLASAMASLEPALFALDQSHQTLLEHFGVATLEAYGCEHLPLAVRAAGALLNYLGKTHKGFLSQLTSLRTYQTSQFMVLDPQTLRNLELFQGGRFGSGKSLYEMLDLTKTAMGARLLRRWAGQPLLDAAEIRARQEMVGWFKESSLRRRRVQELFARMVDMERVVTRVLAGLVQPRELIGLRRALETVPSLLEIMRGEEAAPEWAWAGLRPCQEVTDLLKAALEEPPSTRVGEGGVIRRGFAPELDEVRSVLEDVKGYIAGLEAKERERTGIKSLKVGYNRVFGYYFQVTTPHLHLAPSDFIRRQTLVGGERFITAELKEHEARILSAQERLGELEKALYQQVCHQVAEMARSLLSTADAIAHLDAFCSLGEVADRYGYVRPLVEEGQEIEIKGGRHPMVERVLPPGVFVPNDVYISNRDARLLVLTGPNMSGKSTFIRQVALIVLLTQVGSFVPADSARIGLVDRIFTRVGLQDDLTVGRSTFMVEMLETAHILHHATPRSLIILDEIGRGTSTYDGLAIARAVAEHIHDHPRLGCRTLFATHYHELTELADYLSGVRNFRVAVAEEGDRVVFLYRIVPGGADKSYGIHVAQLAGLPRAVISRAWELMASLESAENRARLAPAKGAGSPAQQLPLLPPPDHRLLEELRALDIPNMTPVEALNTLYRLHQRAQEAPET